MTCEGAFSYLARDVGLTESYSGPVNAEQQGTPQQIAAAVEFVSANNVPAVFCESTVSDAPMQQVVERDRRAPSAACSTSTRSPKPDGPVPTYLDLLRHDADTIIAGLTGSAHDASAPAIRSTTVAVRYGEVLALDGVEPDGRGRAGLRADRA